MTERLLVERSSSRRVRRFRGAHVCWCLNATRALARISLERSSSSTARESASEPRRVLADYPGLLAKYFEIPVEELDAKAVRDPHSAVRIDVDIVRRTLPARLVVSGLVYDVDTGLVEVVAPPATA